MKKLFCNLLLLSSFISSSAFAGSAIFFHPDGMGLNGWQALRYSKGDEALNYDKTPHMGIYVGHLKNSVVPSSNGAATAHAYGVKVSSDAFGMEGGQAIKSASNFDGSIMHEAIKLGKKTALINSGDIIEPGTAAFVAKVQKRRDYDNIALQVMESGVDIILSGGEKNLLPEGVQGKFGMGTRKDGRNLIEEAKKNGYVVVYDKEELAKAAAQKPAKLLGVFAASHTFNAYKPEIMKGFALPYYRKSAPTIAEMTNAALGILAGQEFLMIIEEEGTDNLPNSGNHDGVIEAAGRADAAIGEIMQYIEKNPQTLFVTTSDSDAGGIQVSKKTSSKKPTYMMGENKFSLKNVGTDDYAGGILVRSNQTLPTIVENTEIFQLLHKAISK